MVASIGTEAETVSSIDQMKSGFLRDQDPIVKGKYPSKGSLYSQTFVKRCTKSTTTTLT